MKKATTNTLAAHKKSKTFREFAQALAVLSAFTQAAGEGPWSGQVYDIYALLQEDMLTKQRAWDAALAKRFKTKEARK